MSFQSASGPAIPPGARPRCAATSSGWRTAGIARPIAGSKNSPASIRPATAFTAGCRWNARCRRAKRDPNDARLVGRNAFGIRYTPLTTAGCARAGSRERLLEVARRHPEKLRIELDALATRVIFDESNRALGVEYLKGARLYRAHAAPSETSGERREARASKEVILCGGAFNTPQLLML